ncbi:MAG: hypothetical protein KDK89_00085 [Alphaproteobacteria bacterium]|nr:hypothetical protein [Alphaproteobacteria bacterium]
MLTKAISAIALLIALLFLVIAVSAISDPSFKEMNDLVVLSCAPVAMLIVSAVLLMKGIKLARVVLAAIFLILTASFACIGAFYFVTIGGSPMSTYMPFAIAVVLAAPTYTLIFSRRMSSELNKLRRTHVPHCD